MDYCAFWGTIAFVCLFLYSGFALAIFIFSLIRGGD